jgi:hemolysin III
MGKQLGYKILPFEEKLNVLTHGVSIIITLFLGLLLYTKLAVGNYLELASVGIYFFTLCFMFFASTIYHMTLKPELKHKLRILDHIAIYLLIAGTYTPVVLLKLSESNGYLLFSVVWGIALVGVILKLFYTGRYNLFSTMLYAVMGWLIVIDYRALNILLGSEALFYLEWGGAFYTLGIVFYVVKSIPYNHPIWHVFVSLGAFFHFYFIFKFIV